jgi:hypothetical protein
MPPNFATKLRLTAEVLGCTGRKDLCARFRTANPATQFDLERAHKWLQGKALPRSASVYDDWAKVLGTSRSGAWLAACTIDAFLQEICALYSADPIALKLQADTNQTDATRPPAQNRSSEDYLCGNYACYSSAWSPYYRGHLIRGALLIEPGPRGVGLSAIYSESLLRKIVEFSGPVILAGRTLHTHLSANSGMSPLFISLIRPGPPVSALCGVMSGATVVGPEAQPSMTRMAVIRVPGPADCSNRYLVPAINAIADDLLALGLHLDNPSGTDALLRGFLIGATGGFDQVIEADQVRIVLALDKAYL